MTGKKETVFDTRMVDELAAAEVENEEFRDERRRRSEEGQ